MPCSVVFDATNRSGADLDAREFHYEGCGCPPDLSTPVEVLALDRAVWCAPRRRGGHQPRLRIAYLLPHHNVTGGMKMLLEQMRHLKQRGHHVQAVFRANPPHSVMPAWSDVTAHDELLLPLGSPWSAVLSSALNPDVVVVGFFSQLTDFAGLHAALLYWEQGHEHLFGDGRSSFLHQYDAIFHSTMRMHGVALASVSSVVQRTLEVQFNRMSALVPNGICTQTFFPLSHDPSPSGAPHAEEREGANGSEGGPGGEAAQPPTHPLPRSEPRRVLLVGNPAHAFKGFDVALRVLNCVHREFPALRVTWVCQVQPQITGITFPVEFFVNPTQSELPRIYRAGRFHAFLFTSRYEAWGMPVLEAFATEIPSVVTQCHGVAMFCRHGFNCLMAPVANVPLLASHTALLLRNVRFAQGLAKHARETASEWSWKRAIDALEVALYRRYEQHTSSQLQQPLAQHSAAQTMPMGSAQYSAELVPPWPFPSHVPVPMLMPVPVPVPVPMAVPGAGLGGAAWGGQEGVARGQSWALDAVLLSSVHSMGSGPLLAPPPQPGNEASPVPPVSPVSPFFQNPAVNAGLDGHFGSPLSPGIAHIGPATPPPGFPSDPRSRVAVGEGGMRGEQGLAQRQRDEFGHAAAAASGASAVHGSDALGSAGVLRSAPRPWPQQQHHHQQRQPGLSRGILDREPRRNGSNAPSSPPPLLGSLSLRELG